MTSAEDGHNRLYVRIIWEWQREELCHLSSGMIQWWIWGASLTSDRLVKNSSIGSTTRNSEGFVPSSYLQWWSSRLMEPKRSLLRTSCFSSDSKMRMSFKRENCTSSLTAFSEVYATWLSFKMRNCRPIEVAQSAKMTSQNWSTRSFRRRRRWSTDNNS